MEDYSGVSFLMCTRKLRYLHHSFFHNLDAFGLLCYIKLLVFTNQMLLPFPVLDEIHHQVAFAVWAWENLPPVFHPIWLGMIFEKYIPVSAPWFALSASLIDWSLYTSKTTSILWLDVWLVSTLLSWAAFLITHQISYHHIPFSAQLPWHLWLQHTAHGVCLTRSSGATSFYTCLLSFALSS